MSLTIDFTGRVALVTGATKGVGRGIAQRFVDAGATVVTCARTPVDDLPGGWQFHQVDLRDASAAFEMVDAVVAANGRLDIVVNNAGGSPPINSSTAPPTLTEKIVHLNLVSTMSVSQRANHHMQQQDDGGSIVNISSVSAIRPSPSSAAYAAAKAGLHGYTMTVALEWAPKVRVNSVTVGLVRTELAHLWYGDEEGIAAVGRTIPIGRLAKPEEIGDICVYLASPLASYVTGADVLAHGGGDFPAYLSAANPWSGTGAAGSSSGGTPR